MIEILKQEIIECRIRAKSDEAIKVLNYLQEFADNLNNGWISVDDELPTQSDQYWVAYRPISNYNPNEKTTEICYCIAHFDSYDKIWSVKDQLFYTQRRCKVLFWQPLPNPPKE